MRYTTTAILLLACAALPACHSTTQLTKTNAQQRVAHTEARDAELFTPITQLVGEWDMPDESGQLQHAATFAITGGGSAVREIMFPGQPHEMTNLYHMDGNDIVITHYCAAGNQPRMTTAQAMRTDAGLVYEFDYHSVSNLRPEHDHYMGKMTLTIADDDRVIQDWQSYDRDGNLTPPISFPLQRKAGH